MKEPVDHILRPRMPWRTAEGAITECGFDAAKVKTLSRDEFAQRLKECGQQRTAMLTCMTCSDTARRWKDWDGDPRQALAREIAWEAGEGYFRRTDRGERLKDELIAIAELVEAHREEFDAVVTNRQQRRDWLAKKAAVTGKTAPPIRRL
jgi:hypothetical protein